MNIDQLTRDQQVMLVGLLEAIALSDGYVGEGEGKEIGKVVEALGESKYREFLDMAEERFTDLDQLKKALLAITDRDVRELVYGLALEETLADVTIADHKETELLAWLAEAWGIRVESAGGTGSE